MHRLAEIRHGLRRGRRRGRSLLLLGPLCLLSPVVAAAQVNWDAWKPRDVREVTYPEVVVSAGWLREHGTGTGITVVDARSADLAARARIAGARGLDARAVVPDPGQLSRVFAEAGIPSRGTVICYSDARDPAAAGRLFWLLELAGHPDVRVLDGGLEAWRSLGGETAPGASRPSPAVFDALPDTARLATFAFVRDRLARPGFAILDWRSPEAWGEGHIPHSLPFPLERLVGADGLLRDGPSMRELFAEWGPRPREYVSLQSEFIVAGDDPPGLVPVHPYLAARMAGIGAVRVYPGGFAGWETRGAPLTRLVDAAFVRRLLREDPADPLGTDLPPANTLLVDVRGYREWEIGHVPGAVWLPADAFDAGLDRLVAEFWPGADRSEVPLVVYCYGPTCTRSRNCTTFAAARGFRRLYWFKDGPQGWLALGERLVDLR